MLYVTAFRAMGCQVNIWLETEGDGDSLLRRTPFWVENYEAILSRFRPESELSQLNQHIGQPQEVSRTLWRNIQVAIEVAERTDGLVNPLILEALLAAGYDRSFEQINYQARGEGKPIPPASREAIHLDDPTQTVCLPAPIDLGGIAKGWIVSQIAQRLSNYGACLVDAGGDMVAAGQPWTVGIAKPGEGIQPNLTEVSLDNCAIATSGIDYRHWGTHQHHVIDPRTGQPAETDILSATVIHPQITLAEGYAKALLILGSQTALPWLIEKMTLHHELATCAALIVCKDGSIQATSNFEGIELK